MKYDEVSQFRFGLPPTKEQQRILSVLEPTLAKIDEAEEALERVRRNLDRYRASVLKAACEGRLVPTEAELARQQGRDYEPASQMLQRILIARREAWEKAQLEAYAKKGKTPPKDWKSRYPEPQAPDTSDLTVDVKGAIYEELLSRTAKESPSGAGQYFTPRPVIDAMVAAMQPGPDDTICDPAAGTGGFLLSAHDYVVKHHPKLNPDQMRHVKEYLVFACELVPTTARLCAMNLHLHGIGGKSLPLLAGHDSLATKPDRTFSMVLANPPFGKKGSLMSLDDEGDLEREQQIPVRDDFWIGTSNKQFNFVQHIHTLLKTDGGRAGVVLPDNVLFEGGGGETLRRHLLKSCDVHTLLRLPTGIFYKPGVKANVLFFDKKPGSASVQTKKLWVYDLRTNLHFTLKQKPITLADFDDFLACYCPGALHKRKPTWSQDNPDGRWRSYDWAELEKRDKLDLDLTWLKDES
ncbi:MAG: N-6 DNA methylase, partial [Luteolibacter sp.]